MIEPREIAGRQNARHVGDWICQGVTDDFGTLTGIFELPPGAYAARYSWFWDTDYEFEFFGAGPRR
jgi:hypothetical protein